MTLINLRVWMIIALIPCTCYLLLESIFHIQIGTSEIFPIRSYWSYGKNMSTPREEISGVFLNGRIYIIGGSEDKNKITDTVDFYDPNTDEWHSVASLPAKRDHIGASAYDNKIFVVGGFDVDDITTNQLLIYDSQTNKWKDGAPMPTSRGALIAEFINGILYVVGGVDSSHNVLSTVEAYDPKINKWSTKAPMPTVRHHASSAVVDGKLYVLGGRLLSDGISPINEANLNDNEMYDPQENSWKILPPMPSKRSGLATAVVNSSIYAFGGQSLVGTEYKWNVSNNERYDTRSKMWSSEISMPTGRLGLEAVAADDKIYVVGGKLGSGKVAGANEIFHPVTTER
jgi:N-acetylneuraminic acid mutarotase